MTPMKFKFSMRYLKKVLKKLENGIYATIVVTAIVMLTKTFCLSVYKIPSGSMLPNVQAGDWIGVDKAGYGSVVRLFGKDINTPKFRDIERGDVIVFHFPEGDTVLINNPSHNYYELKRWLQYKHEPEKMAFHGEKLYLPLYYRIAYVKRCVGLPGDTISFKNETLYTNGIESETAFSARVLYTLHGQCKMDTLIQQRTSIPFNGWQEDGSWKVALAYDELELALKLPFIDSIKAAKDERYYMSRFPFDVEKPQIWSPHIIDSLYIPSKGSMISLTPDNLPLYKRVIEVYENNLLEMVDGDIFINSKQTSQYTFKQNYYFVMGDNRYFSIDSRNWGFVPEGHLIGKAFMIGWSTEPNKEGWHAIRWSRIGRRIN